jgi:hypothetical protein
VRLDRQPASVLTEGDEFRIDLVQTKPLRPTGFEIE